jgi:hypothetical protein
MSVAAGVVKTSMGAKMFMDASSKNIDSCWLARLADLRVKCPNPDAKTPFRHRKLPAKKLLLMKLFRRFYVFTYEARAKLYVAEEDHDY